MSGVALSLFIASRADEKSLHIPHSISVDDETIPQTIWDTNNLVEKLEEKYNGVDSLCICQDDVKKRAKSDKPHGQHLQSLFLTIIAASGSNAHAGLLGVQIFPRPTIPWPAVVRSFPQASPPIHPKWQDAYQCLAQSIWSWYENDMKTVWKKRHLLISFLIRVIVDLLNF